MGGREDVRSPTASRPRFTARVLSSEGPATSRSDALSRRYSATKQSWLRMSNVTQSRQATNGLESRRRRGSGHVRRCSYGCNNSTAQKRPGLIGSGQLLHADSHECTSTYPSRGTYKREIVGCLLPA